jgi:hypothetical protein
MSSKVSFIVFKNSFSTILIIYSPNENNDIEYIKLSRYIIDKNLIEELK